MTHRAATPALATREQSTIATRELTVVAWLDATFGDTTDGHVTASDDALIWYTPLLGPTGMLMAHRFATHAAHGLTRWTIAELAATFGMGRAASRVPRVLDRLERFGVICRYDADTIGVRLVLPRLSTRQRAHLPAALAASYPTAPASTQLA